MAFVYEKLTEKDKEYVASFQLPFPLSHSMLASIHREWVADRKRGLFFIGVGGQGFLNSEEYPPSFYYLIWDGQLIRMQAYYARSGNMKEIKKYTFKVHRILAPLTLKDKSQVLIETIKEAITEECRGTDKYFGSIEFVEFHKPFFMEGDVRYE